MDRDSSVIRSETVPEVNVGTAQRYPMQQPADMGGPALVQPYSIALMVNAEAR